MYKQSNHEGDLIDWIQEANGELINGDATLNDVAGIVINAGGYAHTSVALRDAVEESEVPVVEVHISDVHAREPFRNTDLLKDVCARTVTGHGTDGYKEAVEHIIALARQ